MQSTGDFHDEVVIHFLGIAEEIFDNVTAFDASNDMLNDNPYLRNEGVLRALLRSQLLSSRFLLWLERLDALRFIIGKYLSSFPILVGVSKFCIISEFKDWFESESRAPGALITSGMSPFSVYSQISDERFKGPTQPGSIAMAEGAKQLG